MIKNFLLTLELFLGIIAMAMISLVIFMSSVSFINGDFMSPADKLGLLIIFNFLILPLVVMFIMDVSSRKKRK